MTTIVIIYDSKTGNTEMMAKSIAEGVESISGVKVIVKKLGEPFSLRVLDNADTIILGSPAHYSNVTREMRNFFKSIQEERAAGRLDFNGKAGAVFGSYGWDGSESLVRFAEEFKTLGIRGEVPLLSKYPILPQPSLREKALSECREFGQLIAQTPA